MPLSNRTLLRMHVEAVWNVQLPTISQVDIELLPKSPRPEWKLCLATLKEERIYIWQSDISMEERRALRLRADTIASSTTISALPNIHKEVAFSLTTSPQIGVDAARRIARPLTKDDRQSIEEFEESVSDSYFQHAKRPVIGVVVDDQVVCIAHTSRRTSEACELGIDTLPHARRKGYALAATVLWAEMIKQEGLVPIYSAFAENSASLKLAEAAGYRPFAFITTMSNNEIVDTKPDNTNHQQSK